MKHKLLMALLLAVTGITASAQANQVTRNVVLVADARTDIQPLTATEVRRLFLGVPVYQSGRRIIPVINDSDRLLYEVFLQKAIFLSAVNYEKQLVRRVFQHGGTRPLNPDNEDVRQLILAGDHYVTFMWHRDASRDSELRIVQPLWHGEIE